LGVAPNPLGLKAAKEKFWRLGKNFLGIKHKFKVLRKKFETGWIFLDVQAGF
jgi:hypothetical protein